MNRIRPCVRELESIGLSSIVALAFVSIQGCAVKIRALHIASAIKSELPLFPPLNTTSPTVSLTSHLGGGALVKLGEPSDGGKLNGTEARRVLENNLAEYKQVRARAKAPLLKRILRKVFSAVVVGENRIKIGYGTTEARSIVGRDHLRLVASDEKSGAAGLSPFSKRRLLKTLEIKNPPRHPLAFADEEVMGGYIFSNGGPSTPLRLRLQGSPPG